MDLILIVILIVAIVGAWSSFHRDGDEYGGEGINRHNDDDNDDNNDNNDNDDNNSDDDGDCGGDGDGGGD